MQRDAEDAARELHDPLAAVACASSRRAGADAATLLAASYLVDRARIDEFRARVDQVSAASPRVRVVCSGPWPPYSFTQP